MGTGDARGTRVTKGVAGVGVAASGPGEGDQLLCPGGGVRMGVMGRGGVAEATYPGVLEELSSLCGS